MFPIYLKQFESRDMMETSRKSALLRYVDIKKNYYKLLSPEAPDELINPRRSPTSSENDDFVGFVLSNAARSRGGVRLLTVMI